MRKIYLFIIFQIFGLQLFSQNNYNLERIEPPMWWVNMYNNNLELMFYGQNISELKPEISNNFIKINEIKLTNNPNYIFLNIDISKDCPAGDFKIQFKKDNKIFIEKNYELKSRNKNSQFRESFSSADVVYLITPDRFANGDYSNDNHVDMYEKINLKDHNGRHGGDIKGIINSLDYISEMGFTAIWTNPLIENNQKNISYHGYAATDFYKIDSRFGTNEDYKKLVETAHRKNIKIIVDYVLNHCGSGHWWLNDLPDSDWINYQKESQSAKPTKNIKLTHHKRTIHQDIHASTYDKNLNINGWFVFDMPDLNQSNKLLARYLIQNSIWWLEYANIDGIRMDTYSYSQADFMSEWVDEILAEYPNLNIVGEEWSIVPAIVSYWQKGKQNPNNYISSLPSVMDFPLQSALNKALSSQNKNEAENTLMKLYETLALDFLYPNPENLMVFADNHDMDRLCTQMNEDLDLCKIAISYILTTRGTPQIFYGTEVLMTNSILGEHGLIRANFYGGWKEDEKNAFTQKKLTKDEIEFQEYLKKILNWRKNSNAIKYGKLLHFAPQNEVYVYFRYFKDECVMVVINKNLDTKYIKCELYDEILGKYHFATDILSEERIMLKDSIKIKAKSISILQVEK